MQLPLLLSYNCVDNRALVIVRGSVSVWESPCPASRPRRFGRAQKSGKSGIKWIIDSRRLVYHPPPIQSRRLFSATCSSQACPIFSTLFIRRRHGRIASTHQTQPYNAIPKTQLRQLGVPTPHDVRPNCTTFYRRWWSCTRTNHTAARHQRHIGTPDSRIHRQLDRFHTTPGRATPLCLQTAPSSGHSGAVPTRL